MKDRYLFRAKRIDNGEWVGGFYFCMSHDDGRHIHHFIIPLGSSLEKGTPIDNIQVEVDESTVCQCTGLKDKNEKLIWENDIISISSYDYIETTKDYTGIVCYSEKDACWCIKDFGNEDKMIPICE